MLHSYRMGAGLTQLGSIKTPASRPGVFWGEKSNLHCCDKIRNHDSGMILQQAGHACRHTGVH